MLKITGLSNLALKVFKADNNKIVDNSDGRANKTVMNSFKNNKSRNLICMPNIKAIRELIFLSTNAKKTFNYLKQAFIKASIF